MTYRGHVKDRRIIELECNTDMPVGSEVEVEVRPIALLPPGSPRAVLRAIKSVPPLSKEASEDFARAIEEGRIPTDWSTPFGTGK